MDLVVKGRGTKVSNRAREMVERKMERLERHAPGVQRVEMVLIEEPTPRVDGGHRVEGTAIAPHRRFHASAAGPNVEALVDKVIHKLDRQLHDHQGKRRAKLLDGANRVKSAMIESAEHLPSDAALDDAERGAEDGQEGR